MACLSLLVLLRPSPTPLHLPPGLLWVPPHWSVRFLLPSSKTTSIQLPVLFTIKALPPSPSGLISPPHPLCPRSKDPSLPASHTSAHPASGPLHLFFPPPPHISTRCTPASFSSLLKCRASSKAFPDPLSRVSGPTSFPSSALITHN